MTQRDDRICEEATDLWRQLHGGPPPEGADGVQIMRMIVEGLPDLSYARLATPRLRAANIDFPRR